MALVQFEIDGALLERWFLKTAINLCVVKEDDSLTWLGTSANASSPPADLVRAAFGQRRLLKPMGLYAAATVGQLEETQDQVTFGPLLKGESIAGGVFNFRGQRFMVYFGEGALPRRFDLPGTKMPHWRSSAILYHLKRYQWTQGSRVVQCIDYHWPPISASQLRKARRGRKT